MMRYVVKFIAGLSISLMSFYAVADDCIGSITNPLLCETPEILFETGEALVIKEKANALGSPVAIYEYLRNNAEFSLYHGARSNSINTFLSLRGNDVDLASTLIAMLRSQGIPSRYVQGDVRIKKSQLANWLGVQNESLAVSTLRNQGTQHVDGTTYSEEVIFQHVWVEALVSTENYRGAGSASGVDCSASPTSASCRWVQLDPSFKQKSYKQLPAGLDILANVPFNYDAYFNALNPSSPHYDAKIQNKNPLEIYEEQVLKYLRQNYPGLTLEDVADPGTIIQDNSGLLPNSLPFIQTSNLVSYNSVDDHDVVESTKWEKRVVTQVNFSFCSGVTLSGGSASVADLSTKRYTIAWLPGQGLFARLDGITIASIAAQSVSLCGVLVGEGIPFNIKVKIDGAPDPDTGASVQIEVDYSNLIIGGYYLIASGGETSNWSQVHRAYNQLLQANNDYTIVFHPTTQEPYVDKDDNDIWSASDVLLLNDIPAQDALTGGLLFAAQHVYYTRLRESSRRIELLHNVSSPIAAYIGVISSTYEVEYFEDSLPFSIMPGGLLIDLKGIRINGAWVKDQPETYSSETFKLLGHVGSSLEHEVWQELTGYDAVSTIRGIQFALSQGADYLDLYNVNGTDAFEPSVDSFGFSNTDPAGFTRHNYNLFGEKPTLWTYSGSGTSSMNVMRKRKDNFLASDLEMSLATINSSNAASLNNFVASYDNLENQILSYSANTQLSWVDCNGVLKTMLRNALLAHVNSCYQQIKSANGLTDFFNYFDRNKDFGFAKYIFRLADNKLPLNSHSVTDIRQVFMDVNFTTGGWFEYVMPSQLPQGSTWLFNTYIKHTYSTNNELLSSTYAISNKSCKINSSCISGGGYVSGEEELKAAKDTTGAFSNTVFTDNSLVGLSNNDLVATPSTADPVSTATGNMYYDETDFVIAGKHMNLAFTRTYNSGPTTTTSVTGVQQPLGKGWSHSYNMQLIAREEGANPNYPYDFPVNNPLAPENEPGSGVSSITYIDERGGEMSFLMNENNLNLPPVAPRGFFDQLEIDSDPTNCDQNEETCYHSITFPNGTKYIFEGINQNATNRGSMRVVGDVARLHRIESPYGEVLNFSYNAQGKLISISDNLALGRTLTLSYNNGLLQSVSDWSNPARTWTYSYNAAGHLQSVTRPNNDVMEYTYHGDTHYLKDFIYPADRNGKRKTITFSYYENGQAYGYVDRQGNAESLSYDLFRKKTRITNLRGFVTVHEYDNYGAMIKLTEPDGGLLFFDNNADGIRNSKTDALGYTTHYFYNTDTSDNSLASNTFGNVTREQDALGNALDYDYGIYNQLTEVVDKNGNTLTKSYYQTTSAANHQVKGKLAAVTIDQLSRYNNGSLVTHNNVKLKEVLYYADDTQPEFGNVYRIIEYIDSANTSASGARRVTEFTYNYTSSGFTETRQSWGENDPNANNGNGATITRNFDALWRLTSETVQRETSPTDSTLITLSTSYAYDALGRQVRITDSAGNIKETIYDANGLVVQVIARYNIASGAPTALHSGCSIDGAYPNHHSCIVVTNTYDEVDHLVATQDINNNVTTFEYDALGNLLKASNAINNTLRHQYDAVGRLVSSTNENGYKNETRYDLNGRVTSRTDANGNTTAYTYDALGRLTSLTSEEGRSTQFAYDNNGNQTKIINAKAVAGGTVNNQGASIYKEYDELNRVILVRDAMNADTRYTYDLLGNRTSVTDAKNQTTTFVFNPLGRLVEEIDPIIESPDKTKHYSYDKVGNLISFSDRNGEVTHYTYDPMNRLVSVDYLSDATQTTITYDQYGDKTAIGNADVTYTYTYDNQHRLLSKTDSRTNQSLNWTYDAVGNVISKTDYLGNTTTFKYDSTNRLVASSNPAYLNAAYRYDGAGRLQSRILSSGAKTLYDYDKDNRLIKLTNHAADGTLVEERNYTRDALGNITNISFNGGLSIAYSYDANSRLLSADYSDDSYDVTYSYDVVGNRLIHTVGGMTVYYHYSQKGNRLLKVCWDQNCNQPVYHYAYDANGSRIAKYDGINNLIESYTYNQQQLVTSITSSNGGNHFKYDANAYRIQKIHPDNSENNYLLEAEHLEAVYDENNTLKASYLRGNIIDEIISGHEYKNGKKTSLTFHHDQINSVIALSDHNGAIKQTIQYDPFGATLSNTGNSENTLQYTGRENDANGLYYYRARYYDPETGRFISEDPLGFEAGINFYVYVENNPLIFNDPTGLETHVSIGYTNTPIPGVNHQLVILTDTVTGQQFATRGGPEAQGLSGGAMNSGLSTSGGSVSASSGYGSSGGFGFGSLQAQSGVFDQSFRDQPSEVHTVQSIGIINLDYNDAKNYANEFANVTNQNDIPYFPLGHNSNSYASTFVESLTGVRSEPIILAPGSGLGIPDSSLTYGTSNLISSGTGSSANGGFVIYPNKINSNTLQPIYSK